MSENRYAGWKNFETWAVNSWFLEPGHHEHWQEIARQCIRRNGADTESAIHELAKHVYDKIKVTHLIRYTLYSDHRKVTHP